MFARLYHVSVVALLVVSNLPAAAQPVPEFLGAYAVARGELVELKPLQGSNHRHLAQVGGDMLRGTSGIVIDDPQVYFIIYRQDAASLTSAFLEEMKRLRYTFEPFAAPPLETVEDEVWVGTQRGYNLRVAPMTGNPEMMVRAVWPEPIPPGRYGLNIGAVLYDLQIGPPKETCAVRYRNASTGFSYVYTDCEDYFAQHPDVRRPAPRATRSDGETRRQVTTSSGGVDGGASPAVQSLKVNKTERGVMSFQAPSIEVQTVFDYCVKQILDNHYQIVRTDLATGYIWAGRTVPAPMSPRANEGYTWRVWIRKEGDSFRVEIERGTTRYSVPDDIPTRARELASALGLDPAGVTLSYDDETASLDSDEW